LPSASQRGSTKALPFNFSHAEGSLAFFESLALSAMQSRGSVALFLVPGMISQSFFHAPAFFLRALLGLECVVFVALRNVNLLSGRHPHQSQTLTLFAIDDRFLCFTWNCDGIFNGFRDFSVISPKNVCRFVIGKLKKTSVD